MNAAKYDYLLLIGDHDEPAFLRNHTAAEVQQHIDEHIETRQHFRVRQISLDEFCRDVTSDFFPARDPDASPSRSGADHAYRMMKELA